MLRLLVPVLLAVAFASLPQTATAQHFSFGIGHGHGHGHHADWHFDYHDWHDHYWHDHHYWVPPPRTVYVVPAAPVVQQPVVQQVQAAPPARTAPALPKNSVATGRVTIKNAAAQDVGVAFLIDGDQAELADGETQSFTGAGSRIVEFDRGGDFGSTRMALTPGHYEFVVGEKGWQLVRNAAQSVDPTVGPVSLINTLPR
jgi:hypothetical protein